MRVAVVGGGIGGLTAAIALRGRGIEAHVYERARELRPVGAGILMPPNALRVFARLGFDKDVAARGVSLERIQVLDRTGRLLQHLEGGEMIAEFGHATVAILRAELHDLLRDQLEPGALRLGRLCRGIDQSAGGATLRLDGEPGVWNDVVVAADGLHSRSRARLFPASTTRYSGQSCYRGLARMGLPPSHRRTFSEIWGEGRRFGFSPVSEDTVYWYAPFDAPEGERSPAGLKARLFAEYREFAPLVGDIIDATPEAEMLRTDLYDLKPLRRWTRGRVALLGDAAHAATPNLGQGSAQAIEDAFVLAGCLAGGGAPEPALGAYERLRRRKANDIVARSALVGRMSHWSNPLARGARNVLMTAMPDSLSKRQMTRFFGPG